MRIWSLPLFCLLFWHPSFIWFSCRLVVYVMFIGYVPAIKIWSWVLYGPGHGNFHYLSATQLSANSDEPFISHVTSRKEESTAQLTLTIACKVSFDALRDSKEHFLARSPFYLGYIHGSVFPSHVWSTIFTSFLYTLKWTLTLMILRTITSNINKGCQSFREKFRVGRNSILITFQASGLLAVARDPCYFSNWYLKLPVVYFYHIRRGTLCPIDREVYEHTFGEKTRDLRTFQSFVVIVNFPCFHEQEFSFHFAQKHRKATAFVSIQEVGDRGVTGIISGFDTLQAFPLMPLLHTNSLPITLSTWSAPFLFLFVSSFLGLLGDYILAIHLSFGSKGTLEVDEQ